MGEEKRRIEKNSLISSLNAARDGDTISEFGNERGTRIGYRARGRDKQSVGMELTSWIRHIDYSARGPRHRDTSGRKLELWSEVKREVWAGDVFWEP